MYQPLDMVAVMNTPGAFGDYSYPIKLYEAMACGRPVVASRTASTAWVLRNFRTGWWRRAIRRSWPVRWCRR